MKFFHVVFLLTFVGPLTLQAQSFIIDDAESFADFSMGKNNDRLTCFYKTWNSDKKSSHYRSISFDGDLTITDTISYRLNGICSNLGSGENENYLYHIFHTQLAGKEVITFLVTDKSGKVLATYEKTAEDFKPFFKRGVKKLSELQFNTTKTQGQDDEILLLEPRLFTKSGMLKARGCWFALDMLTGTLKWQMKMPVTFYRAKTTRGRLIALQIDPRSGLLSAHYYSLNTGDELKIVPLQPRSGSRQISVFEVDSSKVILAGSEFEKNNASNKHGRYFLTQFDLSGNRIFDRVDTVDRLSGNRLQLLGGAFGLDGDLVILGESYKLDATNVVAGTAASIALSVLVRSPNVIMPKARQIVQELVSARISPTGDFLEFHRFPVDHRNEFSRMIKDDRQVYLRYKDQLWLYDLRNISNPPRRFTRISPTDDLVIFSGNLIGIGKDDKKKEIILRKISGL